METVGLVLFWAGDIAIIIGGIWLLYIAFEQHALWGFGCLFLPPVGLVFLVVHWGKTAKPLLVSLIGFIVGWFGVAMGGVPK